ncbi:MAG: RNA polymerase sigma factor [FCB group bacterium]|nr:RNA polymerase sigma factor [FCB group bacterium]
MDRSALGDEELALALKAGDEAAFDELVRRCQGRVYAVAYRITGNREDALDVAQEVLLKAYRKIDSWQPTRGFLPWLMRLTTNQSIDHLRRQRRHKHEAFEEALGGENVLEPATQETARDVRANEIDGRVQKALVVLSPTQRAVFVLRHYEGLALAEIAESLRCTVGSVKVHLFRALKKLQKELEDLQ